MKTIAIVFALCVSGALAGITAEQAAKLLAYKVECTKETDIDAETIEKAIHGQIEEKNEKLDCFAACMLKKIGIMNADGSINVDVARKVAPKDISKDEIEGVISKCKDTTGANDCETAGNLVDCFMKNKTFKVLN